MWNMFKIDYKDTRTTSNLLEIFHTFFCFYCCLWAGTCLLGKKLTYRNSVMFIRNVSERSKEPHSWDFSEKIVEKLQFFFLNYCFSRIRHFLKITSWYFQKFEEKCPWRSPFWIKLLQVPFNVKSAASIIF